MFQLVFPIKTLLKIAEKQGKVKKQEEIKIIRDSQNGDKRNRSESKAIIIFKNIYVFIQNENM